MTNGKAYHKRILEGREAFDSCYAEELDKAEYPNALVTTDDLKARLKQIGQPVGGNKPTLIERLQEHDSKTEIWAVMLEKHARAHAGKEMLPSQTIYEIEYAAAMIEKHPDLSKCFTGGFPEVSIFWEDDGVPMKARLDYLKTQAVVDLKTFSNPHRKPIDRAIATAMANERYHIQAAVYTRALTAAKEHADLGRIYGEDIPLNEWLERFHNMEQTFVFVFQQTGIAPVARAKVFPKMLTYDCGKIAMEEAQRTFKEHRDRFGDSPWVDMTPIGQFDDNEFPIYMTE